MITGMRDAQRRYFRYSGEDNFKVSSQWRHIHQWGEIQMGVEESPNFTPSVQAWGRGPTKLKILRRDVSLGRLLRILTKF